MYELKDGTFKLWTFCCLVCLIFFSPLLNTTEPWRERVVGTRSTTLEAGIIKVASLWPNVSLLRFLFHLFWLSRKVAFIC